MSEPFAGLATLAIARRLVAEWLAGLLVELEGSGARGEADRWSDVDLVVAARRGKQAATVAGVRAALEMRREVIALFPADHIGLPNLLVCLLQLGNEIAKVDVKVQLATPDGCVLPAPTVWTRKEILDRACGWIWYTFAKVERGEYLEAADGLDLLRSRAVLPLLQEGLLLPREGFRYAEQRLPSSLQVQLWDSRPRNGSKEELYRCLTLLVALLQQGASLAGDIPEPRLALLLGVMQREHE